MLPPEPNLEVRSRLPERPNARPPLLFVHGGYCDAWCWEPLFLPWFAAQGYTFYKTICFSPRGEAIINGTYALRNLAEMGLKPTRGDTVDLSSSNVVAIQISGLGSNIKIYRK